MKKITMKNKILILLSFVFILITTFTISSFAYHEDSNGNLVSDNILNIADSTKSSLGVNFVCSNNRITLNGTATTTGPVWFDVNISSGTYTLQDFNSFTYNDGFRISLRQGYSNVRASLYYTSINDSTTFTSSTEINILAVTVVQGVTYNNLVLTPALVVGSVPLNSYESYGSIFYSTTTLNKVARMNYGPFAYATNIQLSYNNGTSSTIYKNYSNIYELAFEPFINFRNQCIIVDDYKLIFTTLGGNSTWSFTLDFTFSNYSIRTSDFYEWYFYGPIPYSLTFYNSSSLSGTSSGNPLILNLFDNNISSSTYLSYLSFTRNQPNIGLSVTQVGTPNSTLGYDNGYISGYDDGVDQTVSDYEDIIQQYKDNIHILAQRVSSLENSNRNYTNLIWTIGATPWESFKNIWNVEFGGINIANIVTGLVTALLVIYLIKKVWK